MENKKETKKKNNASDRCVFRKILCFVVLLVTMLFQNLQVSRRQEKHM